jgi:hypothetical protein
MNGPGQKVIFTSRNLIEEVASFYIDNLDKKNMLDFIRQVIHIKYDEGTKKVLKKFFRMKLSLIKYIT